MTPATGLTTTAGQGFATDALGTFTHAGFGDPDNYRVSIDWGDGSAVVPGPVSVADGGPGVPTRGSFGGTHQYAVPGTYTITVRLTDPAGATVTATTTITVASVPVTPLPPVTPVPPVPVPSTVALVDGDTVRAYDGATLAERVAATPFGPGFTGPINTATGDLNGDGVADLVSAAGAGGGPRVVVTDGATGATLADFFAYSPDLRGGVYVAIADVDRDGIAELITGAGVGGGPHVKVWDAVAGVERFGFFAYGSDFRGGVRVAAADLDGDGVAEIITAPGAGGGPRVRVFDGRSGAPLAGFMAYAPAFTGGVSVTAGDFDGDGTADVAVAPASEGGPRIRVFAGPSVLASTDPRAVGDFFAGDPAARFGIVLEAADIGGDGRTDLLVSPHRDGSRGVDVYNGDTLGDPDPLPDALALPGDLGGFEVD